MTPAEPTTDQPLDGTRSYKPGSMLLDVSTASRGIGAPEASSPADDPAAFRHERFQIGAKLGEGGMGVVYRARDTRDGRDVALKLMKGTLAGTARRRFEREFRSLSALRHPHCLGVYDYGELGGAPFFTMELFLGQPITSLAARPLMERLEPLLQLTHALDYIHGHGIVHRDVKPSNILVRPETRADGSSRFETRLMDFGLAKYYGVKTSLSAEAGFVGTVAYCSPEQINLDELDHRADLYCLGLVSYEILSGRYVFPEARLAGMRPLIQAHLNDKPRPLAEVNPGVPAAIADLVMKYLRKQPRRRPDSADALRAAIAGHLGIDERSLVSGVSLVEMRPGLSVTGFVCRTSEQELLDDVLRRGLRPMLSGSEISASVIVVSGEPGIGKSSVVQEAKRIARGHGCQVYEGRCFDGNLSPFQPFVEILRQLIAELKLQERRKAAATDEDLTGTHVAGLPTQSLVRLLGIVNEYRGELLRIAPELRKYLPGEAYKQVDYGHEADYIFRALSAFFLEVARLQPICLSFEDLQWADKSSLDLLRHLAAALADSRRSGSSEDSTVAPRLILVASARVGHDQLEALMAQLRDRRQVLDIRLAPLVENESRELIALRLNCQPEELSDDLVSRVHTLCGGNPFFVAETVRDWYEKDAITRSESGWILATEATDTADLPESVRDVMRLRLQGLPPKVQQVLNTAAVIGALVDIDLLREVLPDLSESDVLDAIDLLLPRRVFRETGNPGQVEFVHDLLRELPYADLSGTRRQSLHRRVGERLESWQASGKAVAAAVLADHFRSAEDRPKALSYAIEAAQAALDAYAFNDAIAQLNDALKLKPDNVEPTTGCRMWEMLGAAYCASGRLDDAIGAYQEAFEHAGNRIARGRVQQGIGDVYHRQGQYDDAIRHIDASLSEVGYPRRQGLAGRLLDLGKAAFEFHVLPAGFRLSGEVQERDQRICIAVSNYNRLCRIQVQRNLINYIYCSYKLAAVSQQSGKPELQAVGHATFGMNCGVFSLARLGMHYLRRASKAAESSAMPDVRAMVRAHLGYANYFSGRIDDAEFDLRESINVLDKVGDWLGFFSQHFLRHVYSVRGDTERELAEVDTEIAMAKERGDEEFLSWGLYGKGRALARAGRIDEAKELVSLAIESMTRRKSLSLPIMYGSLGFILIQASEYAEARAMLERSRSLVNHTLFFVEFVGPTYPLLVESLLGPQWAAENGRPNLRLARKAWRESRFARFVGRRFPNYGALSLRVSGRAATALGKSKTAANYFERAIVAAEKLGARYDLARALLDASRIIPGKADEYRRRGQQLLDELGAVVPLAEVEGSISSSGIPAPK